MTTSTTSPAQPGPQAPPPSKSPRAGPMANEGDESDDENWHDASSGGRPGSPPPPAAPKVDEEEEPPKFTDDEIRDLLKRGDELKSQGNDCFRKSDWDGAIRLYTQALKTVPLRPREHGKGGNKPAGLSDEDVDEEDAEGQNDDTTDKAKGKEKAKAEEEPEMPKELTPLEKEVATARSVLNANLAACYVKQGKHDEAVRLCTEALADDPNYVKALHRRATANEALGTWTSLGDAEKDYKHLLELLPPSDPLRTSSTRALRSLPERIEVQKKKETDEMMGKLKDLGNSVLGKFGLSTDNFKFSPNGQGGYSMNFVR
ncbi:hypothetical protein M407DRAFT_121785 [Tulasnella calospora MUT 4182]|uniref:Uncharacterized protein n=1 Tax=Tulasnella calospora MUT 4182 TaxID=1051891 RepID=A0A0C3QSG5_9AGAM|nr:hypothetical protein M407DRAFT_121785 [Tulasnella calospora MUT 4182]